MATPKPKPVKKAGAARDYAKERAAYNKAAGAREDASKAGREAVALRFAKGKPVVMKRAGAPTKNLFEHIRDFASLVGPGRTLREWKPKNK